jgi:hypothetical protein
MHDPDSGRIYVVSTAMWHYGKAVAYAATGDVTNARHEEGLFQDAKAKVSPGLGGRECMACTAVSNAK